jgi:hypothetical protein
VRLELTILELQSSALAAWRRALILYFVFCASFFEVFTSEARDYKHQRTKHKVPSTALCYLERKERFELSKRVWKTRMFPATSLPRKPGTPGRIRTCNLDVRSVAPFQLSYRSVKEIGASYRIRTGVSALATPCLEPTGPTMHERVHSLKSKVQGQFSDPDFRLWTLDVGLWTYELVGEDRIELSPRVPRTRMLALHHTPKDRPKSQVQGPKSVFEFLTLDFGRWTLDYPLTQTTCLISATIFTRSLWLRITALMSL